ncbi:hypothetical protein N7490_002140 [Penicillium lividum]|nr:hypothetical protein N7490_002140 [Penicillium lividum]
MPKRWSWRAARCRARCYSYEAALTTHKSAETFIYILEETRLWEGAALTTIINEFEDLDGRGHGVKIETSAMMPSLIVPAFPWRGGLDYKLFAASINHSTSFITLVRDRDSGRVYLDPTDGRIRTEYNVSFFDLRHIVKGVIACAKIAYITGVKEFYTASREIPPFIRLVFIPKGTSDS